MAFLKFTLQFYTSYHRWITPGGHSIIVRTDWYKNYRKMRVIYMVDMARKAYKRAQVKKRYEKVPLV